MDITIDFESRSPIDIKKCGGYVYWAHPLTEVMMLSVKIDDGPTRVWIPPQFRGLKDTEISDEELKQAMANADVVIAHNAAFERNGFKYGMTRFGFSPIPLEKIRDTSSQALMCALPRDLDSAAKYGLGGKEEKDATGHRLMLAMSKPRAFTKAEAIPLLPLLVERGFLPADATWQQAKKFQSEFISEFSLTGVGDQWLCENLIRYREGKEDYLRLVEYARQDVVVERELYKSLPRIPDAELKVYQWSETVNDRGIMVNIPVVKGIKNAVAGYAERLQQEALELTDGKVTSMKSPIAIKAWLEEHGCMVDSIDKGSVEYLLTLDLDPKVRRFLEIRRKLGKSSIAKYDALLNFSRTDGRFRGGFVYHAAGTGRFGGSGVQLQNLPRISESNSTSFKKAAPHFEDAEMLASGDTDLVEMFWKDPMILASDCLRYMLRSPKGKRFISADYSAVECRGLAWLAGEESTLQAFREGKDIYKQAASGIYHIPYEEVDGGGKGPQRQIGKTAVLACGYGGGWGAMLRFGADKMGLSEEEGTNIVKAWRESNPNVTKLWYDLQKKSLEAMKFRHKRIPVRDNISFYAGNNFLTMRLPSGRDLFYPYAEVSDCEMPWEDANGDVAKKKMVTCMFLTMAKQWVRRPLSHVTLTENLTQAACRDLLIHSAFNLEKAGYPIVMHVHDEVVCEVPEDFGSLSELEEIMARTPDWAKGFPLKAEGWVNWHYQK